MGASQQACVSVGLLQVLTVYEDRAREAIGAVHEVSPGVSRFCWLADLSASDGENG